jgi:ABC-type branched-subunit amino acid transport system ATPase component
MSLHPPSRNSIARFAATRQPDNVCDRDRDLTPLETFGLAVSERMRHGGDWWRRMGTRSDINGEIAENIRRFHLLDVMNEPTATLPYGKQRLLEIALAISTKPRVLLLDEPAAGVPESERHDILAACDRDQAQVADTLRGSCDQRAARSKSNLQRERQLEIHAV